MQLEISFFRMATLIIHAKEKKYQKLKQNIYSKENYNS